MPREQQGAGREGKRRERKGKKEKEEVEKDRGECYYRSILSGENKEGATGYHNAWTSSQGRMCKHLPSREGKTHACARECGSREEIHIFQQALSSQCIRVQEGEKGCMSRGQSKKMLMYLSKCDPRPPVAGGHGRMVP